MAASKRVNFFIILMLGIILGVVLVAVSYVGIEKTSTTEFCLSCHTDDTPSLAKSYQESIHYKNSMGVRAECGDCHIPHQVIPKLITKIGAATDIVAEIFGTLDTPEKWQQRGPELEKSARLQLSEHNSITCKSCHSMEAMDFNHQSPAAATMMRQAFAMGKTNCVTCHQGVGHEQPSKAHRVKKAIAHAKLPPINGGETSPQAIAEKIPDAPTSYPKGALGEMVKLGEAIINQTNNHPLTKDLVGNDLTCSSCHLQGGKAKTLGTFIGSAASFPAFSGREKAVQTLQDRIDNCFMRSMNGIRPIIDSEASIAMASYITWLSSGIPIKLNDKKPVTPFYSAVWPGKWATPMVKNASNENYLDGKNIYEQRCASCHNKEGAKWLWGQASYNAGAGMSKLNKAPAWIMANMPMGDATLTKQEAVDVSIYINAQPRPAFSLQDHLAPTDQGPYNSKVLEEHWDVRKNFAAFGLNIDEIRGDNVIPK